MWNLKNKTMKTDSYRRVVSRRNGMKKVRGLKGKLPVIKWISHRDRTYSTKNMLNNITITLDEDIWLLGLFVAVVQSTKLYPALCDPMDCSTPGFPALYYLSEFAQTHIHWVGDAIQPSHPLLPPAPPALYFSATVSFPMSWLFPSGSQSIGATRHVVVIILQWYKCQITM